MSWRSEVQAKAKAWTAEEEAKRQRIPTQIFFKDGDPSPPWQMLMKCAAAWVKKCDEDDERGIGSSNNVEWEGYFWTAHVARSDSEVDCVFFQLYRVDDGESEAWIFEDIVREGGETLEGLMHELVRKAMPEPKPPMGTKLKTKLDATEAIDALAEIAKGVKGGGFRR